MNFDVDFLKKSCQMFGKKWLKLSHALCFIVVLVWSFFSPLKQISYLKKHIHLLARQIDVQSFLWLVPVRLRCCWNKREGSFDFFSILRLILLKNVSLFSRKSSSFQIPFRMNFFFSCLINATDVAIDSHEIILYAFMKDFVLSFIFRGFLTLKGKIFD